jgi:hypothetical protein
MLRHNKVQNVFLGLTLLAALLPSCSLGGSIKKWRLADVERAPVLIVGKIGPVHKEFRVLDSVMPRNPETWAMTAKVAVLRSYSLSERNLPTQGSIIDVRFFAYGSSQTFFMNGPPLANLQSSQVLILPLQSNQEPTAKPWMLLGVDGLGLTVPARAELPLGAPNPSAGRQFILEELANSLGHEEARANAYPYRP